MTSYSMLEKVRYSGTPSDVVALKEYIVFKNEQTGQKCVMCKFANNLNQRLYGMRFEICQYDESDALIEKTTLSHDKFSANGNECFVPSAKFAVNEKCKNISYKLLYAAFDKVKWENGAFSDNDYQFERYVHDEKLAEPTEKKEKPEEKPKAKPEKAARKEKKDKAEPNKKNPFVVRDVTKKNYATFPTVYRVLTVIVVLALVCVSAVYFTHKSDRFSVGDYDVRLYENDTVGICAYDGDERELVIPAKIGKYTVTRIESNAFKKSKLRAVAFESEQLVIDKHAFENCKSLTTVAASGVVVVTAYAFDGCSNIKMIFMPKGTVNANAFYHSGSVAGTDYAFETKLTETDGEIFGEEPEKEIEDFI